MLFDKVASSDQFESLITPRGATKDGVKAKRFEFEQERERHG